MTFWTIAEKFLIIANLIFVASLILYAAAWVVIAVRSHKDEENGAVEETDADVDEDKQKAFENLSNDYDLLERQYEELLDVCATASTFRDIYRAKLAKAEEENERLCEERENMIAQLRDKTDG